MNSKPRSSFVAMARTLRVAPSGLRITVHFLLGAISAKGVGEYGTA